MTAAAIPIALLGLAIAIIALGFLALKTSFWSTRGRELTEINRARRRRHGGRQRPF